MSDRRVARRTEPAAERRQPGWSALRAPRRAWPRVVLALGVVAALATAAGGAVLTGVVEVSWGEDTTAAAPPESAKTEPTAQPEPEPQYDPVLEPYADPAGQSAHLSEQLSEQLSEHLSEQLLGALDGAGLGAHVGATVHHVGSGELLFDQGGDEEYVPASTTKILTAVAVLDAFGPNHRFDTVVGYADTGTDDAAPEESAESEEPAQPRSIVLVGGGDPLLASQAALERDERALYPRRATIDELAEETAARLRADGVESVELLVDDTRFGQSVSPDWEPQYVPSAIVAPVSALWVDEAKTEWPARAPRADDPALHAAGRFADLLADAGITVVGDPDRAAAPTDAPQPIAKVESAPLDELVEHILLTSDNDAAEVLGRQVAVAAGEPATFAGMTTAMTNVLERLGVDMAGSQLYDASGLSRANRLTPRLLTSALLVAADPDRPRLRAAVSGLPVAGYSGTLRDRFAYGASDGLGYVRAKTGTLTGVSSLAGVVTTQDGDLLAFALLADQVEAFDPRPALDAAAAALSACGCRTN